MLVIEDGSERASQLWTSGSTVASSVLSYPESRAAVAAARRGGRITARRHSRALVELEELTAELVSVDVDERLARHAGEQAEALGLRGYDAVHLATALELHGDVAMITWDKDLRRAAEGLGLAVNAV